METKKLKIALCCDSFYPMIDGVVNVVDNYARILSKKHDVTVFVPESPDKNYKNNFPYKVVRCKISPIHFGDYVMPTPALDKNFKKALDQDFDIIHLHSPFTVAKTAIKVAKKRNIPLIVTLHSQFKQDFKEKTKSRLLTAIMMKYIAASFNSCQELWTMNPKMEELSHKYGFKGKVFLLPNGCDLKKETLSEEKAAELKNEYSRHGEKILLYVGRIHKLKNIEFILKTCQILKGKGFPFKMIFVGSGQDYEKFKKMSTNMNLDNVATFAGKISDRNKLQYFYEISDLFVFPSFYDTDGIVKNEAAAFQTPTIFVDGSIASSGIQDNHNGFVGENDPNKFAEKIVQIFTDEKTYRKVCLNAEKDLYKSWEEIVDRAEQHYYSIIKNSKKGVKNGTKKGTKSI